jgi:hypothetical protein
MIRSASRFTLLTAALVTFVAPCLTAQTGATPRTGADVLEAMRSAYAGKWYHTLTFKQKTTMRGQDGTEREQTWHETLAHTAAGTKLRIDFGDLSAGNGVLYTPDSSWRVRGGKAEAPTASGNEFLPLIEGVYVQPVTKTIKELGQMKVDMSRVRSGTWKGKPVWIVGASSPADTTSPQFWIETDRKVLVRMVLPLAPDQPPFDVQLAGYERVGNGAWLSTKIEMFQNGVRRQAEEYSDWKVDVPVDPALFDLTKWSTAPHWAK